MVPLILDDTYTRSWLGHSSFCGLWRPPAHNGHLGGTRWRAHTRSCPPPPFPKTGSGDMAFTSSSFHLHMHLRCIPMRITRFTIKNDSFIQRGHFPYMKNTCNTWTVFLRKEQMNLIHMISEENRSCWLTPANHIHSSKSLQAHSEQHILHRYLRKRSRVK